MSKNQKTRNLSVKVESELADFLNSLPNRSEFIRFAIVDLLRMKCPLCAGTGVVRISIGTHFIPIIDAFRTNNSRTQDEPTPIPPSRNSDSNQDSTRLE